MDWKYLYFLVSFSIGILAGYQGLHDRFKKDSWSALSTLHGVIYIVSRGFLPGLIFILLYSSGVIRSNVFIWSLFLGTGSEVFLRTTFYLKEEHQDGGTIDVLKGPFDILHWYQNLMLEESATSLAAARKRFVKSKLPKEIMFITLRERVLDNLPAYPHDQEATKKAIESEVLRLTERFDETAALEHDAAKLNKQYCELLGYAVLNSAGKKGFNILLSD